MHSIYNTKQSFATPTQSKARRLVTQLAEDKYQNCFANQIKFDHAEFWDHNFFDNYNLRCLFMMMMIRFRDLFGIETERMRATQLGDKILTP
jgi:hypothetical protein